MRIYFYLLSGAISSLLAWLVSRLILDSFSWLQPVDLIIIIIPLVTIFLVIGTVLSECLVANASRPKLVINLFNRDNLLQIIIIESLVISLFISVLLQLLVFSFFEKTFFLPSVGLTIVLTRGFFTWRICEVVGTRRKIFLKNLFFNSFAILLGLAIFQLFGEQSNNIKTFNSLISFLLLGIVYSFILSFDNSPFYQPALRAGAGFEYKGENYIDRDPPDLSDLNIGTASIRTPYLKFVHDSEEYEIEEGTSISLLDVRKIIIGSEYNNKADISLPGLPPSLASIRLKNCQARLVPVATEYRLIKINGERLVSASTILLDHNYELTFDTQDGNKFYKFAFYNRFLDPAA